MFKFTKIWECFPNNFFRQGSTVILHKGYGDMSVKKIPGLQKRYVWDGSQSPPGIPAYLAPLLMGFNYLVSKLCMTDDIFYIFI